MPNCFVHFFGFIPSREELPIQTTQARLFLMPESSHSCVWLVTIIDTRHHHSTLLVYPEDSQRSTRQLHLPQLLLLPGTRKGFFKIGVKCHERNSTAGELIVFQEVERNSWRHANTMAQRINCKTIQWITGVCPQDICTELSSLKKMKSRLLLQITF